MDWVTGKSKKGKERNHMCGHHVLGPDGNSVLSFTACKIVIGTTPIGRRQNHNPTAPKCKNCLRVLRRLIEK